MFEYFCDKCNSPIKSNHVWTVKFKYASSEGVVTKHFCAPCKKLLDIFMEPEKEDTVDKPKVKEPNPQKEVTEEKVSRNRESTLDLDAKDNDVPMFVDFMNSFRSPIDFMSVEVAKQVLALKLNEQKVSAIAKHYDIPYTRTYNFTEKYLTYVRKHS